MMKTAIICSFVAAAIYGFLLATQNGSPYTFFMMLICLFHVVWVVYAVLKDKHIPEKTFDEYLYQDSDKKWS